MNKKQLDTTQIANELRGQSAYFPGTKHKQTPTERKVTRKPTQKVTPPREKPREVSSADPREKPRKQPYDLPTRDAIQEFSFRLRDELKVKVQAEVPHQWQKELEQIARDKDVKKLELYRYILGVFLGKVKRKDRSS